MADDLSEAMRDAVPEPPSLQGWVAEVRRRRARRRGLATGACAVAVLAVAVPLALQLRGPEPMVATSQEVAVREADLDDGGDGPEPEQAAAEEEEAVSGAAVTLDPATGKPGAAACYDAAGNGIVVAAGQVRPGATRAWLCAQPGDAGLAGPLEPLVTDIDVIVEAFEAQPSDIVESAARGSESSYYVVFEYGDGSTAILTGTTGDDAVVSDGRTVRRVGAEFFDEQVAARWLAQREALYAPEGGAEVDPGCPPVAQAPLLGAALGVPTGGAACRETDGVSRRVDDALVRDIALDLPANSVATITAVAAGEPAGADLVLVNAWGDQLVLHPVGAGYEYHEGESLMLWTPSASIAARIEAALR